MGESKEGSIDEYLGFAPTTVRADPTRSSDAEVSGAAAHDDGAYEDSWYQVLKAKAEVHDDA